MSRIVSTEEAQKWLDGLEGPKSLTLKQEMSIGQLLLMDKGPDLAYTVVQQAEQIAAVLALHTGKHVCDAVDREFCATTFDAGTPCPTAQALGVTA